MNRRRRRLTALLAGTVAAVTAFALPVLAAEPTAGTGTGGDPRSSGQGPGLVGDPLFAIGAVMLIGLISVLVTVGYVRLTDPTRGGRRG